MSTVGLAAATLAMVVALGVILLLFRHRAYHRLLTFDPKQNYLLGISGPGIESVSINCDQDSFFLPEPEHGSVSALLEVDVRASMAGRVSDPAIEITSGGFQDVQYFERGVDGVRFLNLSRLLRSASVRGGRVQLKGRRVAQLARTAVLHVCCEKVSARDRVLIVAPHPDDAEIAAFGFYADTNAIIVTLTAGDASDRYQSSQHPWMGLSRERIAQMRVWDSITVPQLGGIPLERAVNFCFPDRRLAEMYRHPDRDFCGEQECALLFRELRGLNRSPLVNGTTTCAWRSLVCELRRIISETAPTIVVTPHPRLDPNSDHLFTTVAVVEALESVKIPGRMFFYIVHNHRSELWPFGPAGSGVALPPILADDGACASGFYSHTLSAERQMQKFMALEAMHDIREVELPESAPLRSAGRRLRSELRGFICAMGRIPTNYLRRAVRPDEIFLVMSIPDALAYTRRALEHNTGLEWLSKSSEAAA
jgi:LmbE family N-acetylglucosaminyl deacetylase